MHMQCSGVPPVLDPAPLKMLALPPPPPPFPPVSSAIFGVTMRLALPMAPYVAAALAVAITMAFGVRDINLLFH